MSTIGALCFRQTLFLLQVTSVAHFAPQGTLLSIGDLRMLLILKGMKPLSIDKSVVLQALIPDFHPNAQCDMDSTESNTDFYCHISLS